MCSCQKVIYLEKPSPAKRIRRYACYYGPPDIPRLSRYDLVIIEPAPYTAEQIAQLKISSLVVGYCSVGELDKHELKHFEGKTGWFLDQEKDGTPDLNKNWDSYYANPFDPGWQEFILAKIEKIIGNKGCDGIFMDTLDTVDEYPEIAEGMADLVHKIRSKFPNIYLIANRGFKIFDSISSDINSVMFECFTSYYYFEKKKYRLNDKEGLKYNHMIYETKLVPFLSKGGVVLSLDYALPKQKRLINQAWSRAIDYGFVPAITQVELDKVSFFIGRRDSRFLRKYGRRSPLFRTSSGD